jgi:hypothetical protein
MKDAAAYTASTPQRCGCATYAVSAMAPWPVGAPLPPAPAPHSDPAPRPGRRHARALSLAKRLSGSSARAGSDDLRRYAWMREHSLRPARPCMLAPARAALPAAAAPLRAARRALARVSQLRAALRTGATSAAAPMLSIHQFPALGDNYGYLLHDEATGATAAVDTPEARRGATLCARDFGRRALAPLAPPGCSRARCEHAGCGHRACEVENLRG